MKAKISSCYIVTVTFLSKCSSVEGSRLPQPTRSLQQAIITKLELINARNDTKILDLYDGLVINMIDIVGLTDPNFNINALTSVPVAGVRFGYNGNKTFRTETSAPYAFCGNRGTDFYKCSELTYGFHSVNATSIVNGVAGPTVSIRFTIVAGSGLPPVSVPIAVPIAMPVLAPAAPPATLPTVPVTVPIAAPVPVATAPVAVPVPVAAPFPVPVSAPVTAPVAVPVPVPIQAPVPVPVPIKAPVLAPVPITTPQGTVSAIQTLRLMYTGVDPSVPVIDLVFDKVNVIDLRLLNLPSGKFNIDALIGPGVKSVAFSNGRIETSAPMAYCGNNGNAFYDCDDLIDGANVTVTVTAYPMSGGMGIPILTRSTTIQMIRPLPPVAPTPPTVAPVAAPIIPPVPGCPVPKVRKRGKNRCCELIFLG
jgi:hypothetical protein